MIDTRRLDPLLASAWLGNMLRAVVISVLIYAIAGVGIRALRRRLGRSGVDPTLVLLWTRVVQVLVLVVVVGAFLSSFEGRDAWLISAFGGLAVVLGLAVQDVLKSVFAGVYILVERPFRLGDDIEVDGRRGIVIVIRTRITVLEAEDGARVIVPNSELFAKTVIRRSPGTATRSQEDSDLPESPPGSKSQKVI